MPYPSVHIRAFAYGHFGSSTTNNVEQWQAGWHIAKPGGITGGTTEMTAFLTAIRAAVTTYHTTTAVAAGANCFLDGVGGAYIGTDGKYALGALQSTTQVPLTTSTPGVGATNSSWATSVVLTLRSLAQRGPSSHGRIYWPATGIVVPGATGVLAGASTSQIVAAAATMLNAINTAAAATFGTGANVSLVSPKLTGFQTAVTRVGVGQKVDHMESRERRLAEAHVFSNLTVSAALLEAFDADFREQLEDLVESQRTP